MVAKNLDLSTFSMMFMPFLRSSATPLASSLSTRARLALTASLAASRKICLSAALSLSNEPLFIRITTGE
jgi:hypothetical protein